MSAQRAGLGAILEDLARLPDPQVSDVQARRYDGSDLSGLETVDVWRECERARILAAILPQSDRAWSWWWQRLGVCEVELRQRKGRRR